MLRQPSRPTFEPEAATITGLTRTSSPWLAGAFGWPEQSTTATRTSSPICGAAIPTQWPKLRIVSSRSAITRPGSGRRLRAPREQRVGVEQDVADQRTSASTGRRVSGDALVGRHRLQPGVERLQPQLRRHGDVDDHHVEVAREARLEVADVDAGVRERARDGGDDAGVVGAVDGDDGGRLRARVGGRLGHLGDGVGLQAEPREVGVERLARRRPRRSASSRSARAGSPSASPSRWRRGRRAARRRRR